MADLSVKLFDLDFPSPVWTAAGPAVRNGEMIRRQVDGGAGAAVCKTISSEAAPVPKFHMMNLGGNRKAGLLNSELWSELPPEQWLHKEYAVALRGGVPVIASLGYSMEEVVRLGSEAEQAGVHALEVTVHYAKEEPWRVMRALREAVSIPIIAKMSPHDPATVIDTARKMEPYVDAIAAINSLGPCLRIDIENESRIMGSELGYGWLSGPPIKPLALRIVFDLARSVKVPVIGVGGVRSGRDVVEFLMAGASAVQVCTANILEGPNCFTRINRELGKWLDAHGRKNIAEIQGAYLKKISAGGAGTGARAGKDAGADAGSSGDGGCRVHLEGPPVEVSAKDCTLCKICVMVCPYDALEVNEKKNKHSVIIDEAACFSCGLCVTVCPQAALSLNIDSVLGPAGPIRP